MTRHKYTPEQRTIAFWSHVNKNGSIPAHMPHLGKCWEWTGFMNDSGYGLMAWPQRGHQERVHRISWILNHGEIPNNLFVLHKCDNRLCLNPSHLFLGTQLDNILDKLEKGRQPQGEQVWNCKLSDEEVENIKRRKLLGEKQNKLALEYKVSTALISLIVNNINRTSKGK